MISLTYRRYGEKGLMMKDFIGKEFEPVEMHKLIDMISMREDKDHFKVADQEFFRTPQVVFYDDNGRNIGDAVCNAASYGHEEGLIEVMGFGLTFEKDGDEVKGYMTAEEVLEMFDNFRKGN